MLRRSLLLLFLVDVAVVACPCVPCSGSPLSRIAPAPTPHLRASRSVVVALPGVLVTMATSSTSSCPHMRACKLASLSVPPPCVYSSPHHPATPADTPLLRWSPSRSPGSVAVFSIAGWASQPSPSAGSRRVVPPPSNSSISGVVVCRTHPQPADPGSIPASAVKPPLFYVCFDLVQFRWSLQVMFSRAPHASQLHS